MTDVKITGSALARWRLCQYGFRQDVPWTPDGDLGEAAKLGTAFHEVMAIAGFCGPADEDVVKIAAANGVPADAVFELMAAWQNSGATERIADALAPYGFSIDDFSNADVEVPFAWDPAGKARRLPQGEHREYKTLVAETASGWGEIPCTIDELIRFKKNEDDQAQGVLVIDYKTGWQGNIEPAIVNTQIRFAAMCAALSERDEHWNKGATVPIVSAGCLAHVSPDGVRLDIAVYDYLALDLGFDFEALTAELRSLLRKTAAADPNPGGAQCRWCRAAAVCPAIGKALATVHPDAAPPAEYRLTGPIRCAEEAAYRYAMLRPLKVAVDGYEETLKRYAREQNGIDAGAGKVWRPILVRPEKLNLDAIGAPELLKDALGPVFTKAIKITTSKDGIGKALRSNEGRAFLGDVSPKDREEETFEKLRQIGALVEGEGHEQFREVKR